MSGPSPADDPGASDAAPGGPPRSPQAPTGGSWLRKVAGSRRTAAGFEWTLWRRLPMLALAGTLLPLVPLGLAHLLSDADATPAQARRLMMADFLVAGWLALHWTLIATAAIGCVIVMIMKGPQYTADSYRVPHRDRPGE